MTVAELIRHLQTLPQDARVVAFAADEDYSELEYEGVEHRANWEVYNRFTGKNETIPVVKIIGG